MKRLLPLLWLSLFLIVAACTPNQAPLPETSLQPTPTVPQVPPTTSPAAPATRPPESTPLPAVTPTVMDDDTFTQAVTNAIVSRDDAAMRHAMHDRFTLAYWQSEGSEVSAGEAIEVMRRSLFVPGSDPVTDVSIDVSGLLGGGDPLLLFGPQSNAFKAFHVTGLGADAAGEAIAVLSRDPATGQPYWHGLLFAAQGFDPLPEPVGDLDAFSQQLADAIQARDFTTLRSLMPARFSFATWNTQLLEVTSEEAMQRLSQDILPAGASPVVVFGTDVAALLQGTDPLSIWGPVANPVKALHVMGLGHNSNEEGVLVIGRNTAGEFYWHGLLLSPDGYFHAGLPGVDPNVLPTDVQYVMAREDVNVRSGPGLNYAVEGLVRAGQTARVSGISLDRAWWRIICTQDASGYCWISADPNLTEPTSAP